MKGELSYSLPEYYPWRKNANIRYPWLRQNLNHDFLKYEQKRIKEISDWRNRFRKADSLAKYENISIYVIPTKMCPSWEAAIANFGDYNYFGLSALFNSPQAPLIGLFPRRNKQPRDYELINIITPKKINLLNMQFKVIEPVVIVDNWIPQKSDKIYVDIKPEGKIIEEILNENLLNDEQLSRSFQAPLVGAPFEYGSAGGISLSSISSKSSFAKELVKMITLMVPPEYRIISPPSRVFNGIDFTYISGIKFHIAERPYVDRNVLSSMRAKEYNLLKRELKVRDNFAGEYSIFSTFTPSVGNETQLLIEWTKNFMATEVALPWELGEIMHSDVDLTRLKKAIDEELWIQIAHFHQIQPKSNERFEDKIIKYIDLMYEDYSVCFSDFNLPEESRNYMIRTLLPRTKHNLIKIAQSCARVEGLEVLNIDHLKFARNLMLDNLNGLLNHPKFDPVRIKTFKRKKIKNNRFIIVQTELINNPFSTTLDLFETIKSTNQFKDIYDLQAYLEWLHKEGDVIIDRNKKYYWIGR